MLKRNPESKIAVISDSKAEELGIFGDNIEEVYVDGNPVDIEVVDTNSVEWNLPNIVIKANAYLELLRENKGNERFINVYSNKMKNFNRLSDDNILHEAASDKTIDFLNSCNYKYKESIEQYNYLEIQKKLNESEFVKENLLDYEKEIDFNESIYNDLKSNDYDFSFIANDEMLENKSDLISNLQILLIRMHNDFLFLKNASENKDETEKISALILRVKNLLQEMGYSFDKLGELYERTYQGEKYEVTSFGKDFQNVREPLVESKQSVLESYIPLVEIKPIPSAKEGATALLEGFEFGKQDPALLDIDWGFDNILDVYPEKLAPDILGVVSQQESSTLSTSFESQGFAFGEQEPVVLNTNWDHDHALKTELVVFNDSNFEFGKQEYMVLETDWGYEFDDYVLTNNVHYEEGEIASAPVLQDRSELERLRQELAQIRSYINEMFEKNEQTLKHYLSE